MKYIRTYPSDSNSSRGDCAEMKISENFYGPAYLHTPLCALMLAKVVVPKN